MMQAVKNLLIGSLLGIVVGGGLLYASSEQPTPSAPSSVSADGAQ